MKIIFLDVDGVLNHDHFDRNRPASDERPYPLSAIDPISVGYLNQICLRTGAKVVISSSWKDGRSREEMHNILSECGFVGEVIGMTPILNFGGKHIIRGNEILKWIIDNEEMLGIEKDCHSDFESYVILDDDQNILYEQRNNFVHVDKSVGLTSQSVLKAIKILSNG